ncbi:MAG: hypothetical protein HZB67_03380 [Candidatus Aenigmarchaeota archaeon]|nr:hypothetical protein [Candidatus Aenigmarchaeota archaeon]
MMSTKIDLSFKHVREFERTKHVHRLHPYLGKFIPQLVEVFLKRNFTQNDVILDPFSGSGTTLVESNILGIDSIGIELSKFNCMITKIKTQRYDLGLLEKEILDILKKTQEFSMGIKNNKSLFDITTNETKYFANSEYLNIWFAKNSLKEILFYLNQIQNYTYQDILKIILTRSARSARLVPHFELTRAEKPVYGAYYCHKHNRTCFPVDNAIKFINRYSLDTIKRIKEFSKLRTPKNTFVLHGDSKSINIKKSLKEQLNENFNKEITGIFTSPPYVGLIDYHDQHRYAYELLGMPLNGHMEIGTKSNGSGKSAQKTYQEDIIQTLVNLRKQISDNAKIFFVVNDKNNLYNEIAEKSGFVIIERFERPVLMKASRERTPYSESILHMVKN